MGSLTNVLDTLERVIDSKFEATFPTNRSVEEIEKYLSQCNTLRDTLQWHSGEIIKARTDSQCPELVTMCQNVARALLESVKKADDLWKWSIGKCSLPVDGPKDLLYSAIEDILVAFRGFEVVAYNPKLRVGHVMRVVQRYLRKVFGVAVILCILAGPEDWFDGWAYLYQQTKLEGFNFDTRDSFLRSQVADPTIRGVLVQLDKTPSLCLPANPDPPRFARGNGPYANPILRNALWTEREETL